MTATLINLTPHAIKVLSGNAGGNLTANVIPTSGKIARIELNKKVVNTINDITIWETTKGNLTGLPDPELNTFYIVSTLIREYLPNRVDLLSPGELIRNDKGEPIGCLGLVCNI